MAVLVSKRDETAKLGNIDESLDHEREAQVETRQLLADLKDKEAIALEMIAILRGVRGPSARHDRKAARKALAKVKQRRTLAEQSLRRSQNRLKGLEEQSADVNHAVIKKARELFPYASPNASIFPPSNRRLLHQLRVS
jgi:predicted nucleotide-binding protein (sugar kinase/HSP70/actin superfamily)